MISIDDDIEVLPTKNKQALQAQHRNILMLIAEGNTAKEIGAKTNYSSRTVEALIVRMRDEYGAKTQAHLISICYQKGILKII